jgi:glycosyltransferase involved in cell wall biosynthesis
MSTRQEDATVGTRDNHSRRYVIIMPSRNEEQFIGNTLDCLVRQTALPTEVVIVSDGSTDRTGDIGEEYGAQHPWIHVVNRPDRGTRVVGGGVIEAFYAGYEALRTTEYDYICKLDADLTLPDNYFEWVMGKMEADPRLGSASAKVFNPSLGGGKLFEEGIIDEQVSGAAKFYRKAAFEDIGGFVQEVMWDGIDFHTCRMKGWTTRSFRDDEVFILHHRLMGSSYRSIYHGRLRWGRGQWFMGTHPFYIIASGVFRMRERPFIIGGLLIIVGFFSAMLKGSPRYAKGDFRKHLHSWQLGRLGLGCCAPKVTIPDEPES